MELMTGKWNVYKCKCGCKFAIEIATQKDKGYEVCPDCDLMDSELLGEVDMNSQVKTVPNVKQRKWRF